MLLSKARVRPRPKEELLRYLKDFAGSKIIQGQPDIASLLLNIQGLIANTLCTSTNIFWGPASVTVLKMRESFDTALYNRPVVEYVSIICFKTS